jgi:hypothetical protein
MVIRLIRDLRLINLSYLRYEIVVKGGILCTTVGSGNGSYRVNPKNLGNDSLGVIQILPIFQ